MALFDGDRCIANRHRVLGRGHAEQLVPMIAALPDQGHAETIAVSRGPGSFTGTRIGIAAARALALAWQVPVLGYPTLALVAALGRQWAPNRTIGVVMNGGHGEWFVQEFTGDGLPLHPHAALPPSEAADRIRADYIAGSRATPFVAQRGFGTAIEVVPDASHFASLPDVLLSDNVQVIYGRAPDAKLHM